MFSLVNAAVFKDDDIFKKVLMIKKSHSTIIEWDFDLF